MPTIHRLLPLLLAAFASFGASANAAEGDLERAERLRAEAKALRSQAEDTLQATEPGCYERFLVNRCLAQAKEARLDAIRAARELEAEATRLETTERQRQVSERGLTAPTQAPAPAAPAETRPPASPRAPVNGAAAGTGAPVDADAIRRERQAEAERAAAAAQTERRAQDAEKARERKEAEAEAAERAEQARRDRARYDERIRKREAEKAEEARKAGN